jgi:RNA polymerase sigma-70 factor (ECF subfamily)
MAADYSFEIALDHLIEHDYARIVRAVALFTGTVEGAEDAVQEALARAMESSRRGRHIDSLEGWVMTAAFNQRRSDFRRIARRRRHDRELESELRTGSDAETLSPQLLDLRAAVRSLPRRQREVVVLHYYLDQSIESVARELRIREGAVKNALHKARRTLLGALAVDAREESAK